jgi:hypothetical protein
MEYPDLLMANDNNSGFTDTLNVLPMSDKLIQYCAAQLFARLTH